MEEACLSGSSMFSPAALSSNRLGEHENAQIERHDIHMNSRKAKRIYNTQGGSAGPSARVDRLWYSLYRSGRIYRRGYNQSNMPFTRASIKNSFTVIHAPFCNNNNNNNNKISFDKIWNGAVSNRESISPTKDIFQLPNNLLFLLLMMPFPYIHQFSIKSFNNFVRRDLLGFPDDRIFVASSVCIHDLTFLFHSSRLENVGQPAAAASSLSLVCRYTSRSI